MQVNCFLFKQETQIESRGALCACIRCVSFFCLMEQKLFSCRKCKTHSFMTGYTYEGIGWWKHLHLQNSFRRAALTWAPVLAFVWNGMCVGIVLVLLTEPSQCHLPVNSLLFRPKMTHTHTHARECVTISYWFSRVGCWLVELLARQGTALETSANDLTSVWIDPRD